MEQMADSVFLTTLSGKIFARTLVGAPGQKIIPAKKAIVYKPTVT